MRYAVCRNLRRRTGIAYLYLCRCDHKILFCRIELAVYGLRVLAPAIFIFAIVGTFRGYFQGYSNMVPTAVSQVIEQIVNAIVTVVCAGIMYSYGMSLAAENGNEFTRSCVGSRRRYIRYGCKHHGCDAFYDVCLYDAEIGNPPPDAP